ncbi:hypothetical protein UB47_09575 [Pseudomonas sp. 5]|nr:hypothetical protein UB47_09575 [Pseudomonas sp. 5]
MYWQSFDPAAQRAALHAPWQAAGIRWEVACRLLVTQRLIAAINKEGEHQVFGSAAGWHCLGRLQFK